jgi:hypothetical protein
MQNEVKTCEKFMLFVLQKEVKIMRNGLRFASISHEAKKNLSEKGTPYPCVVKQKLYPGFTCFRGILSLILVYIYCD